MTVQIYYTESDIKVLSTEDDCNSRKHVKTYIFCPVIKSNHKLRPVSKVHRPSQSPVFQS